MQSGSTHVHFLANLNVVIKRKVFLFHFHFEAKCGLQPFLHKTNQDIVRRPNLIVRFNNPRPTVRIVRQNSIQFCTKLTDLSTLPY
jgi:hypothetical protein